MRRMYICLFCLCILLLTGCSPEEDFPTGDSTLILRIPNASSRAAGNGDANAGEDAVTHDEGKVSDLWFMAYPTNGEGERFVRHLEVEQLDTERKFNLKLKYGTYRIYVAANLPGVSNGTTEDELKNTVLSFKEGGNLVLPATSPYGLPMFYAATAPVTISEGSNMDISANLVFLCSKLKYTIAFDNTSFSGSFNPNGFKITDIIIKNIATSSALFNEKDYSAYTLNNQSHEGNLTLTDNQQKKWNYTGTVYLPEHYITDANKNQLTCLEIKGVEINLKEDGSEKAETTVEHTYLLPLGGEAYPTTSSTSGSESKFEGGSLERGHYYDLTAKIKGVGKQELNVTMNIYEWTTKTISVDLSQTELWVSRTGEPQKENMNYEVASKGVEQILVTSLDNDSILYKTNASVVTLECEKKNGKDLVRAIIKDGKILFSVNPEIALSEYTNTKGTARVAVKANNLIKQIDVQYNVTPYFNVSPLLVEIQTNPGEQDTYAVSFETNLGGGITISPTTLRADGAGNGSVAITCTDTGKAQGKIYLQADGNTKTSWEGTFTVKSKSEIRTVRVIVKPEVGDYIIHFIAINDDCTDNGEAKIYKELYNGTSPTDGWENHNIYIYTQYGITNNGEIPNSVWYFFDTTGTKPYWPGVGMESDPNNKGWMYYKLSTNALGKCDIKDAPDKTPKPGETLIMFNSGYHYLEIYNHRHRYPYDLEPGVSLFDFLDKEGWFVYDPTSNAYEFSAEKPELVLVTYTMYTKAGESVIDNWYREYGKQENIDKLRVFGIKSTHTSDDFYNLTMPTSDIDGWNKTELRLWAVKGKEGKAIIVKNQTENNDKHYGIMFGGQIFKENTGYFDNGWYEGKPTAARQIKGRRL